MTLDQQVNLYQPIMGAERRLFSARAIAVALTVLAVCLVGLSAYGSRRTASLERSLEGIERQEATNLALSARANQSVRPGVSVADLDADARRLSADIDLRQRALDVVRRSSASPATGFAARLEALARRQIDGIWLTAIIVGSGEGLLGMQGGATDAVMVPTYLAGLAQEPALAGVRFDRLSMRRASPADAPAVVVFELDGPGLEWAKPAVSGSPVDGTQR